MKITISKSQWHEMGKKAGWIKTAGEDWMVNDEYTKQISDELSKMGDQITSINGNRIVVNNHKILNQVLNGLLIEIWEGSYENDFILIPKVASTKRMLGMVSGKTAIEAINNMDNQLGMIIDNMGKR